MDGDRPEPMIGDPAYDPWRLLEQIDDPFPYADLAAVLRSRLKQRTILGQYAEPPHDCHPSVTETTPRVTTPGTKNALCARCGTLGYRAVMSIPCPREEESRIYGVRLPLQVGWCVLPGEGAVRRSGRCFRPSRWFVRRRPVGRRRRLGVAACGSNESQWRRGCSSPHARLLCTSSRDTPRDVTLDLVWIGQRRQPHRDRQRRHLIADFRPVSPKGWRDNLLRVSVVDSGSDMVHAVLRCETVLSLTNAEFEVLLGQRHRVGVPLRVALCELVVDHDGSHVAFVMAADGGERWWWVRWDALGRAVLPLEVCGQRCAAEGDDCLLPVGHVGPHSFEL